ncbi:conserved hypothetical protein [Verticillium alfalfae VaMs.102]|uniref:C3H1-type domain-containing protein n=1 Tax=Verticillium alfalfae (strain VaMs.102 / ATCC MYA-4576 / FGSC 10136) TaxID=526221 RepID=C9S9E3_VERA1|nr:conserved hypothetical protein [Verticillium alfalfae VaMs.102]EEY16006.1 conserved hypothetical protein [Verticillium alfalfae VaMs.102]
MQDWQNTGQTGAGQDQNALWSDSYSYQDGANQFENVQSWSHPMPGQDAYSQLGSSHQGQPTITNDHDTMSTLSHGGFHHGSNQFALDGSYSQPAQDQSMQALDNFHQDIYSQPASLGQHHSQTPSNGHGHPQQFSQAPYQYQGQGASAYNSQVPTFPEAQLITQQRQQSHTPIQQHPQFDLRPQTYSPAQGFSQPQHQHQLQPHLHQQQQQPRSLQPDRVFSGSPHPYQAQPIAAQQSTHQNVQALPNPSQVPYEQAQFIPQQQMGYSHPSSTATFQPLARPPTELKPQSQPQVQHQASAGFSASPQPLDQQSIVSVPSPQTVSQAGFQESLQAEQAAKKRKRTVKKESEPESAGSPRPVILRTAFDNKESLVPPTSTDDELAAVVQFAKRPAAAKKAFPLVPGAHYLISTETAKLPTPKSYDRLAPLVALPSQSGRRILPGANHELPCEIQGKFTDKYKPSLNFVGKPEDREREAKPFIDQYQKEMKALGNRKPKYADYPFTFQEQLKADEAAKAKAQRKARKEEEEERKKPIRPEVRPVDPVEAAAWDVLGIVYIDPSAVRTNALIAGAVQSLGEFFIKLRAAMTKAKQEVDQAVKEKRPESEVAQLQKVGEQKKDMFVKVLDAAHKHGDDAVVENLGGHQKGVLSLVNLLIGCIKATDYSGPLPKATLRFMSNINLTKKVADAVNFETVRKRFADKGDSEVKELIKTVASRIKKEEPVNGADAKKSAASAPVTKLVKPGVTSKTPVAASPTKRPHEDDTDSRPGKKLNVEGTSSVLGAKVGTKPQMGTSLLSKLAGTKARPANSSTLAGKNRLLNKTVIKPEGSASKKDTKQSEVPETPEEQAKRLRKEARRKLRVTWRPEAELVQVRIFHKEAAEDQDNMTRDAADDRSEGMMLKQRGNYTEDDDEDDELPYRPWTDPTPTDLSTIPKDFRDKAFVTRGGTQTFHTEEQDSIKEREGRELLFVYTSISDIPPTPKSPVPEPSLPDSGAKIGHLPRDGPKYQEIRNRWSDIASQGPDAATYYAAKRLHQLKDDPAAKIDSLLGNLVPAPQEQTAETYNYNMTPPQQHAKPLFPHATQVPPIPHVPAPEQVLSLLASERMRLWRSRDPYSTTTPKTRRRHDYPDPGFQAMVDALEELFAVAKDWPFPATAPPAWLANNEERSREWRTGLRPAPQSNEEAWAAYYQQQQQHEQYAQYMALLQQAQQGTNGQGPQLGDAQLQALLGQISLPQAQTPGGGGAYELNPNDQGYQQLMALSQLQQQQQQAPAQQGRGREHGGFEPPHDPNALDYDDLDYRDRGERRDSFEHDERDGGRRDRDKNGKRKGNAPGGATLAPHRPANKALIGTKPCSFWQQGKCARGDKCTFRHDN